MRIRAPCLAAIGVCVAAVATLQAGRMYPASGGWVGIAATATIDEGDLGKILLNDDGSATIRPTINTSAKLRFQVPETHLLMSPEPSSRLPSGPQPALLKRPSILH
jgi:hypothetical protein